mmetsp:Transcript_66962/g.119035  ORF Transcript_66962/g.119035 Transcript_66962/m.119035 type:complete len:343 (+) Transcript_66962:2-1030(+)
MKQGAVQMAYSFSNSEDYDVCWDFTRRGWCPRGNRCRYMHKSRAEEGISAAPPSSADKPRNGSPGTDLAIPKASDAKPVSLRGMSVGTCGFMGLKTAEYAKRFQCVELNYTWHDGQQGRRLEVQEYSRKARELSMLKLSAVIKVSGHATHEMKLQAPDVWWPRLWECYGSFAQQGVLAALLWQLPPSLPCSDESLQRLGELAERVAVCGVRHVFEFRHPSWYGNPEVIDICKRHSICIAWVHFENSTRWAGEMPNGWSPENRTQTADFIYLRLFGPEGRNLGAYSDEFLSTEIIQELPRDASGFIMFAQNTVPDHARRNAARVRDFLNPESKQSEDAVDPSG